MEETKKQKDFNWLYKLGFLILLGFVLGIIFSKNVLGADEFKWQICGALNLSAGSCDDWWASFKGTTNQTTYTKTETDSKITEITSKFAEYYKKNETDNKLNSINQTINNTIQQVNFTGYALISDLENKTRDLRDSLLDRIDELQEKVIKPEKTSNFNPLWIIAIGGFILVGYYLFNQKLKPKTQVNYEQQPKTATPENLDLQEAIKKINKAQNTK